MIAHIQFCFFFFLCFSLSLFFNSCSIHCSADQVYSSYCCCFFLCCFSCSFLFSSSCLLRSACFLCFSKSSSSSRSLRFWASISVSHPLFFNIFLKSSKSSESLKISSLIAEKLFKHSANSGWLDAICPPRSDRTLHFSSSQDFLID